MGLLAANVVNTALEKFGLIPDVIEQPFAPTTLLQVEYLTNDVAVGNQLIPEQTKNQPTVDFVPPDALSFYTLVMIDPNAPSELDKKFGPWRHWVAINISGSDIENSIKSEENQHTPYIGPGPGANTGIHRYTFLLYKQKSGKQQFEAMPHQQREDRRKFDIRQFETVNQLELISANFFTVST